jgi:hypothetical protein
VTPTSPPPPYDGGHALPLANLDGSQVYSSNWSGGRILHVWFELADGSLAQFEPGRLNQDSRPRVVMA